MKEYIIASFYKFVSISNFDALKQSFLIYMQENQIKGTLILSPEGINGSVAGNDSSVEGFFEFLRREPSLADLEYKKTIHSEIPFDKAKVKIRKEIVSLGIVNVNPLSMVGTYVKPAQWNALITSPNVVVVDTRNIYEVTLGTFKEAINPNTLNFREFPEYVTKELLDKKDQKIAMFCTGGIRCEKSTAYLKNLGFKDVYHLEGGILNYLDQIPENDSLWQGSCFVFDDRIAIDSNLKSLPKGSIDSEWKHNHKKIEQV